MSRRLLSSLSQLHLHLRWKVKLLFIRTQPELFRVTLQRSAKVFVRGCEKFVIDVAYLFCLALVGSCSARFAYFLANLCSPYTIDLQALIAFQHL